MTAYNALVTATQNLAGTNKPLSSLGTFACGAGAGIVTVYTTMPFDVIKTRMQSLEARTLYRNSFDCARRIVADDGVTALWGGSVARLSRLMVSLYALYHHRHSKANSLGGD